MVVILLAILLAKTITFASKIVCSEIYILSDSEIALYWREPARSLPQFVDNQKQSIIKIKDSLQSHRVSVNFRRVPTADNPADSGTRVVNADHITDLPWICGPQWLREERSLLRMKALTEIPKIETEEEVKTPEDFPTEVHITSMSTATESPIIPLTRFSRLSTALRTTARVCKALLQWVNKINKKDQM